MNIHWVSCRVLLNAKIKTRIKNLVKIKDSDRLLGADCWDTWSWQLSCVPQKPSCYQLGRSGGEQRPHGLQGRLRRKAALGAVSTHWPGPQNWMFYFSFRQEDASVEQSEFMLRLIFIEKLILEN